MKFRRKKKLLNEFLSRSIIGLGYGLVKTKDLILNKELGIGTQDAMDALSVWIGRELMKTLLENNIVSVKDSDEKLINALMDVINLAEDLEIDVKDGSVNVVVQKCLICPKRIGGYDLEGNTSCPVGGIVTGAIGYARGTNPIISRNNLQTAEICHIDVETN